MASILGKLNLFRYRAYVYDEETELYYMLRNNPSFDPSTARIRDIAYAANYDGW